jgi:transposase
MSITTDKFEVKASTKKEMAAIYGVSVRTFNSWIKPFEEKVGEKRGRYYTVNQVLIIVEVLGLPGVLN